MSDQLYYIHNRHDKASREWVAEHKADIAAGTYIVIDWYDEPARDALLKKLSKEHGLPLDHYYRVSEINSVAAYIGRRSDTITVDEKAVTITKPKEWRVEALRTYAKTEEAVKIIADEQEKTEEVIK